jgi:hypothetical protein
MFRFHPLYQSMQARLILGIMGTTLIPAAYDDTEINKTNSEAIKNGSNVTRKVASTAQRPVR